MAIRLNCDVADTKELLTQILRLALDGKRVMFLDEPGRGAAKMQAMRVRLSRVRANQRNKGRKRKYFTVHNTIHPHTEGGKRYDAVVVWTQTSQRHEMIQELEDLVGHGDTL